MKFRYLPLITVALVATFATTAVFASPTPETPSPVVSKPKDSWSGSDKKMHLGVSFVLGMATAAQWPDNKPLAFAVAMAPGVLKEISDRSTTGFSAKDLVADAVGVALGMATTHWLITRRDGNTVVAYRTEF